MVEVVLYFFLSCGPVKFASFDSMEACVAARDQITEFDGLCLTIEQGVTHD